jgi:hypothetical protein
VDGRLAVGEVVTLHVDLGGYETVRKHVVSRVDADRALCWTIRTRRPWLMRGERCQTLEDLGDGRTAYCNDEQVHGVASWFVVWLGVHRRIRAGIEAVGVALKVRCEGAEARSVR